MAGQELTTQELTAAIRTILTAGPLGPSAIYGKLAPELQRLYSLRVVSEQLYKMRREGSLRVNGSGRMTRYELAERRQAEHAPPAGQVDRRGQRWPADKPPSWAEAEAPAVEPASAPLAAPSARQAEQLARRGRQVEPPAMPPPAELADMVAGTMITLGREIFGEAAEAAEAAQEAARVARAAARQAIEQRQAAEAQRVAVERRQGNAVDLAKQVADMVIGRMAGQLAELLAERDRQLAEAQQRAAQLLAERDSAMALAEQTDLELQQVRQQLAEIVEHNGQGIRRLAELAGQQLGRAGAGAAALLAAALCFVDYSDFVVEPSSKRLTAARLT